MYGTLVELILSQSCSNPFLELTSTKQWGFLAQGSNKSLWWGSISTLTDIHRLWVRRTTPPPPNVWDIEDYATISFPYTILLENWFLFIIMLVLICFTLFVKQARIAHVYQICSWNQKVLSNEGSPAGVWHFWKIDR